MTTVKLTFTAAVLLALAATQADAAILLTWFPASDYNSNTSAMNATLGITGDTIDTFETTTLIPGLTITLSGGVTTTTWTSLPNLNNSGNRALELPLEDESGASAPAEYLDAVVATVVTLDVIDGPFRKDDAEAAVALGVNYVLWRALHGVFIDRFIITAVPNRIGRC